MMAGRQRTEGSVRSVRLIASHLALVPSLALSACAGCGRRLHSADVTCERCGARLHFRCWRRLAMRVERDYSEAAPRERGLDPAAEEFLATVLAARGNPELVEHLVRTEADARPRPDPVDEHFRHFLFLCKGCRS